MAKLLWKQVDKLNIAKNINTASSCSSIPVSMPCLATFSGFSSARIS
ncbi:MAG: hypothetical protein IJH00_05470 [Erysipelotrichaceae bacterium]|nr:hypothetical protein [Erysipelotrichaceae bacterium]